MVVRTKPGVSFSIIAPGGFRILSAIDQTAQKLDCDLIITSACDGEHSGPNDPHHRGEAYDVRTHDFSAEQKQLVLAQIINILGSEHFFAFLEAAGTANEHLHAQVRKGTVYPSASYSGS
jgi:hypothetical protein